MANEEMTPNETMPQGRVSRWKLFVPVGALLALFVALAGFWFWSIRTADAQIDAWIAREAALGRNWTCPDRSLGGFPFRIEVRCKTPRFVRNDTGLKGELEAITAVAQIYNPTLMIIEADGPLKLNDGRGTYTADWGSLRASLRGRPGERLDRLSIDGRDLRLNWTDAMGTARQAAASQGEFHIRRDLSRPAAEHAYDIATSLVGFALPALDPLTGGTGQAAISFDAVLTHADPLSGHGFPGEIERWRVAGGKLIVRDFSISKDASRLGVQGELQLDDRARPQGSLDIAMTGLDVALKSFGVPPIRGDNNSKTANLKLRFERGQIFFGPIPIGKTFPLY
jgi:hypothetical protein